METKCKHVLVGLTTLALLTACGRESNKDLSGQGDENRQRIATIGTTSLIPACNASDTRIIAYREVLTENKQASFRNDELGANVLGSKCIGTSAAFNRFLMTDGSWVSDRERLTLENSRNAESSTFVDIVVIHVTNRDYFGNEAYVSEIGNEESFDGVVFSKWTASTEKMNKYNIDNPDRKIGNSPQWSINGTLDDATRRPIHLGCTEGTSFDRKGNDLYINAGRTAGDGNKTPYTTNCNAWFSLDFGKTKRAMVKVTLAGDVSLAPTIIENVRKELLSRLSEISE